MSQPFFMRGGVTYIVSQTTAYKENSDQSQHTNCSITKIKSSTVLLRGKGSILVDGNRVKINTQDGLQPSELQQFIISFFTTKLYKCPGNYTI